MLGFPVISVLLCSAALVVVTSAVNSNSRVQTDDCRVVLGAALPAVASRFAKSPLDPPRVPHRRPATDALQVGCELGGFKLAGTVRCRVHILRSVDATRVDVSPLRATIQPHTLQVEQVRLQI